MISRKDKDEKFRLTKEHSIPYLEHSYYNNNIVDKMNNESSINQDKWDNESFRKSYLKYYFEKNPQASNTECYNFIKEKLSTKININDSIMNEIKNVKLSMISKNKSKDTIINQLINMEDENGKKLCNKYTYEYNIKRNTKKKLATLYVIINETMIHNLNNNQITQYFGDATYHAIPPTIHKYKLFVISGFNFREIKIHICCYDSK